jgi:HAD superfamily hydrolase (TIGR01509 family)
MPIGETTVASRLITRPRWEDIDVVLLDMDGTLLDLRFDNYFWLELVPERFAEQHGMSVTEARAVLMPRFAARQGTLQWYCTDFWTRELSLSIAELKREVREHVQFLPGAERFLCEVRRRGKRTVLVTNAHLDSLAIKAEQTKLLQHFDMAVSSHQLGAPKEDPQFWARLGASVTFDPNRALFIDDSLPVLRAARQHGIAQLFAVIRPDSTQPARIVEEFPAIQGVADLIVGERGCLSEYT